MVFTDQLSSRNGHHRTQPTAKVRMLAEVQRQPVTWLWAGRVPYGAITVLDGDPGTGKSFLTLDLAARLSRGTAMPGAGQAGAPGNVLLLGAEDDLGRTIRPRLEDLGADLCRVLALEEVVAGGEPRMPVLPDDLPLLGDLLNKHEARLMIIDPLMAYISGDVDSHKDSDVRRVMAGLRHLAEQTGAAVLLVRHLNKSVGTGDPIYRGGGSIGIIGAARSALLVGRDPDDPELRIIARVKGNLCRDPGPLAYRIEADGRLAWVDAPCRTAADLIGKPKRAGERRQESARENAVRLLRALDDLDPKRKGAGKREVRVEAGMGPDTMDRTVSQLVEAGQVKPVSVTIKCGRGQKTKRRVDGIVRTNGTNGTNGPDH